MLPFIDTTKQVFQSGCPKFHFERKDNGTPGWLSGWASAFGSERDPGAQDRVPRRAPCMEPASPYACVSDSLSLSLFVSLMNK